MNACSSADDYRFGLYTEQTFGTVKPEKSGYSDAIILLVIQYNKTFIETSSGYLDESKGKVIKLLNTDTYSVVMPLGVHLQRIYFLTRDHAMAGVETSRSIGVGAEEYNVRLKYTPDWKNNFTFHIRPFLLDFLEKYQARMAADDLKILYDFLEENERDFLSKT